MTYKLVVSKEAAEDIEDILMLFARRACELEMFEALGRVNLLVIDDLGAEKRTEWSEQTIYTIIDERYSRGRATMITTNLSLEELEEKVGYRTMDRLIGSCRIVENCASSYRQEMA